MALAYAWHAAREKTHYKRPPPRFRPGTFGNLFRVDKLLAGTDRPQRADPYAVTLRSKR